MEIIPNNVKILVIANMYGKSKTSESITDSTKNPVSTQTPIPTQTTEYYKPSMTFSKLSSDTILFNPLIKLTDAGINYDTKYKQLQFFIPDKFNELNKQNANSGKIIYTNDTNQTIILEKDAIYLKGASLFSPSIKYTFDKYNPTDNSNTYKTDDPNNNATLNLTNNIITIGKFQFNPTSSKTLLINNSNDGTVSNNIKLTLDNIFSANSTFNNYTIYNSKFDKNLWNFNTINYSDNYKNSIRVKKPKEVKFENLYNRIVEVLKKYYEGMYADLNKPFLTLADDNKKNDARTKYTNNNSEVIQKFPLDKKNYSVVSSEVNTIIQKVLEQYLKTNINTNFFSSLDEYNLFIKYLKDIYENSKELDSKNIPYDVRWFKDSPPYFYIKSKELDDKAFNSAVAVATGKGAVVAVLAKGAKGATSGTGPSVAVATAVAAATPDNKTLTDIKPIVEKVTTLLAKLLNLGSPLEKVTEALNKYAAAAATSSSSLDQTALNTLFNNLTKYQTDLNTIIKNQSNIETFKKDNDTLETDLPTIHDCITYHSDYGIKLSNIKDTKENDIKQEIIESTKLLKKLLDTSLSPNPSTDIDKMVTHHSTGKNHVSKSAAQSLVYLDKYQREIESLYKNKIREYENNLDEYIDLETENKTLLFDMSNASKYSKIIDINNLKIEEINKKIEYTINNFYDSNFNETKANLEKKKGRLEIDNQINQLNLDNKNEETKMKTTSPLSTTDKEKIQKKIQKNKDKIKEIEEKQTNQEQQNKISGGQIGEQIGGSNNISLPNDLKKYFEQYKLLGDNIHKLIPNSSSSFVQDDISKMELIGGDSGSEPQEKQNFFNSILVAINNFNNANMSNQIQFQFTSKSWLSTSPYTITDLYNELIGIFKKDVVDNSADIAEQFWFNLCKTIMKEIIKTYTKKTYDEIKEDIENKKNDKLIYKALINEQLPIILNPSYNGNDNLFIFNNKFYKQLNNNNFKLYGNDSIEQMIYIFKKKMNISITYFYIDNNKIATKCELNASKHNLFLYYNNDVFNLLSFNTISMYYIPKGVPSTNDIDFIKNINNNVFPPLLILLFLYVTCSNTAKIYPFDYIENKIKNDRSSNNISSIISTIKNYKFGLSPSDSSNSSSSYGNQVTITKSAYCYYITITLDLYEGKLPFMQKQTMGCDIKRNNIMSEFTELTGIKVLPTIVDNKYLSLLPQDAAKPSWLSSITGFLNKTGLGTRLGLGTGSSADGDTNKGKPTANVLNKPVRGGNATRRKIMLTYKRQNNVKEIKDRLSRKLHNITHKLFKI
jgi:hypothetical protein